MANTIKHKRGSGSNPSASDLVAGEIAIRTDTGVLFTKKDDNSVVSISGGSTNLGVSTTSSAVTVTSSTGNNATISEASGSAAGVMSTAHHDKLDGIEANATADQTAAEIRTLVESASDSNVFTDADHTKLNGIESGATADQTASEILTLLKTVDGAGSGLDADTLDGITSGSFLRSDAADTMSGNLTVNARLDVGDGSGGDTEIRVYKADNNVSDHIQFYNGTTRIGEIGCEDTTWLRINQETSKNIYTPRYIRADAGFFVDGTSKGINGSGNFIGGTIAGASDYGTLLRSDADDTTTGNITISKSLPKLILDSPSSGDNFTAQGAQISLGESGDGGSAALHLTYVGNGYGYIGMGTLPSTGIPPYSAIRFKYNADDLYFYSNPSIAGSTNWHSGNDGSGSGLDADTVDGIEGSNLMTLDGTQTITGNKDFDGTLTYDLLIGPATSTRDKVRVWSSSSYTIGMQSGITFGGLNDYGMTFQFNNESDRGFWWGDTGHSTAQGAMALTTEGKLTVAHSVRIGYGEADTTTPGATHELDVSGQIHTSTGILFNNDTAAANTLDDYEEGTWTPGFAGSGTAGSYSVGSSAGRYTKVGNLVTVFCEITDITRNSAGTGGATITGLPFTAGNIGFDAYGTIYTDKFSGLSVQIYARISSNADSIRLRRVRDGSSDLNVDVANFTNTSADIGATVQYLVD